MKNWLAKYFAVATVFVFFLALGIASSEAQTSDRTRENVSDETPTIFDVRKSLPMEPTDPSYHDFYINAGVEVGFKKGQYLPVQRALPVHDPVQNKQQAILTVPVGKVLIIHVERNMAVARLVDELGDDERPTLEYEAIMIGDRIDMKGVTMDAPKETGKKRKKTAAMSVPVQIAPASSVVLEAALSPVLTPPASEVVSPAVPSSVTNSQAAPPANSNSASQPSSPPRVTQPVPPPTA